MLQIKDTQRISYCSSTFVDPCANAPNSEKSVNNILEKSSLKTKRNSVGNAEADKHKSVALQLNSDEYSRSLQREPRYMRPTCKGPFNHWSLWKYKVTTDEEWNQLYEKVEKSMADHRSEKRVRVDASNSATVANVHDTPLASVSTTKKPKSILRHIDEDITATTDQDQLKVADLLERLEKEGSDIVDYLRRSLN